jgi:hypothetical protein
MKATDDGYMMSSWVSSFISGLAFSGSVLGSFMGAGYFLEGWAGELLSPPTYLAQDAPLYSLIDVRMATIRLRPVRRRPAALRTRTKYICAARMRR